MAPYKPNDAGDPEYLLSLAQRLSISEAFAEEYIAE